MTFLITCRQQTGFYYIIHMRNNKFTILFYYQIPVVNYILHHVLCFQHFSAYFIIKASFQFKWKWQSYWHQKVPSFLFLRFVIWEETSRFQKCFLLFKILKWDFSFPILFQTICSIPTVLCAWQEAVESCGYISI